MRENRRSSNDVGCSTSLPAFSPIARRVAVVMLALLGVLASCGGNTVHDSAAPSPTTAREASDEPVRRGGSMVLAVESPISTIDPMKPPSAGADPVVRAAIYDTLFGWSEDGSLEPRLAEKVTSNETFDTWTVTLRPGITFSDGSPVDAAAIKSNWDFRQDPANCACAVGFKEDTAVVVDPLTVRFTLSKADARWASYPGPEIAAPATLVAGYDREARPIGSGAFTLADVGSMVLKARPDYWRKDGAGGRLPRLDELQLVAIAEPSVRLTSLQNGEVDATTLTDGNSIGTAETSDGLTVLRAKGGTLLAVLNAKRLSSDLRRAMSLALDRDALSQSQPGVRRDPATGFATPSFMTYSFPEYDLSAAKKLVERIATSTGGPPRVEVVCANVAESSAILPVVVNQLQAAGIEASLTLLDPGAFATRILGGRDFDAACFRVPTFQAEPAGLSGALRSDGDTNIGGLDDPEIDAAFEADLSTTDPAHRRELFQKVADRVSENLVYVPLLEDVSAFVLGPDARVGGVLVPDAGPTVEPALLWTAS